MSVNSLINIFMLNVFADKIMTLGTLFSVKSLVMKYSENMKMTKASIGINHCKAITESTKMSILITNALNYQLTIF